MRLGRINLVYFKHILKKKSWFTLSLNFGNRALMITSRNSNGD